MHSALTSGYHLAFLIGAALVTVAIIVAVPVLEPTERAEERATSDAQAREEQQPRTPRPPSRPPLGPLPAALIDVARHVDHGAGGVLHEEAAITRAHR